MKTSKNTTAAALHAGAEFTDDMGHTHVARRITRPNEIGVYVYVEGQSYPEFYLNETKVAVWTERPFYAYTRKYLANGDCKKGLRTFNTRAELTRFVRTTNLAVTAHN